MPEIEIAEGDIIGESMVVKISRDGEYVALVKVLPYKEVEEMEKTKNRE